MHMGRRRASCIKSSLTTATLLGNCVVTMIVRTMLVELSTIPGVAYRQKLLSGTGLVVMRYGTTQPGLATLSRTSGDPVPASNANLDLYPINAFREAFALTSGLPFSRRGKVQLIELASPPKPDTTSAIEDAPLVDFSIVDSPEYQAVLDAYTSQKGELSFHLLNKDFIQFASSSKTMAEMIASNATIEDLRNHAVRAKFETLTGNTRLTDTQLNGIVELLDEISPRSAFREFEDELRRMLSQAKG